MKCPVCDGEIKKTDKCRNCGYKDIRTEFINSEELEMWQKYVVYPCRFAYQTAVAQTKELQKRHQKELNEIKKILLSKQDEAVMENDESTDGFGEHSFKKLKLQKVDGWITSGAILHKRFYECKSYNTRNEINNIVVNYVGNMATISFLVKKTYDKKGNNSTYFTAFKWKLKDDYGIVVADGRWSNDRLQVGDVTTGSISLSGLDITIKYVLELVDD